VKLQDPTLPFASVVPERRATRAAADGERFRLGTSGLRRAPVDHAGRVAVIAASGRALQSDQVEGALAHIGLVGGILADLGFEVTAAGALADDGAPPALFVWVCGDHTAPAEARQLAAFAAPGLSIGARFDGLEEWGSIEPEDHPDDLDLIAAIVTELRSILVDGERRAAGEPGSPQGRSSTVSSTVRHGTGKDEPAQRAATSPRSWR
jgi:hypothetical protein